VTTRDPDRRPKHAAGDGDVPSWWTSLDRRRLAVALGSTFVAVPVVVLDNLPRHHGAEAEAVEILDSATTAAAVEDPATTVVTVRARAAAAAPSTTAAPTTTTARPTTTTTAAPSPTTTTTASPPPPPPVNTESGTATWYQYRDGECAHKTLPRGTVLTVTNVANGRSATCVVTDRGPYGGNRIVDLDDGTFAQLAPLSAGVIDVTITW
jgi:rare lipoprotein A